MSRGALDSQLLTRADARLWLTDPLRLNVEKNAAKPRPYRQKAGRENSAHLAWKWAGAKKAGRKSCAYLAWKVGGTVQQFIVVNGAVYDDGGEDDGEERARVRSERACDWG